MVNVRRVRVRGLVYPSKIGEFAINPYVGCPHRCLYCYAACINYSGLKRPEAWGDFLDVKVPSSPIDLSKIFRRKIIMSTMTDPYNPYEEKALVTRGILREILPAKPSVTILTKSGLAARDTDILKLFPRARVTFSFSSMDDGFRKLAEPYASSPKAKLEALKILNSAGIKTSVFVAPFFPNITNAREIVNAVAPYCERIWFDSLNLRPQNRESVLNFIRTHWPELYPLYEDIYLRRNSSHWHRFREEAKSACRGAGVACAVFF